MARHRVVILGGGFGGLYCCQALAKADADITLIDKRNFHLFQPLLYQVATGSLSPGEIAAPLRSVTASQKNLRVLMDEAVGLDAANKKLLLKDGEVPYDTLVVSTGAQGHYFGNDQWEEFAPGLKTIEDATRIRHKILFAFEAAERETDPEERRAWLTFVIVGGGPTGVELAGALGEIAFNTLRREFDAINPADAQILLVDNSEVILSNYPRELSEKAERHIVKLGVRPRGKCRVTAVDDAGVTLKTPQGEERIATKTVIWAAGVKGSGFGKILGDALGAPLDKGGRVVVQPDLTVPGHPEVLVLGDLANFAHGAPVNGVETPLPGVAPVAMQMGRYAAKLIQSRLAGTAAPQPFAYFDKGSLAVIGRAAAVAYFERFGKRQFSGFIAWLLWLFVHLMYLVEFENRLLVFFRWGINYLTYYRGARLITGFAGPPPKPAKDTPAV
jgi:NADH:ubiquinone reductase (H+-translocating)